MGPLRFKVKQNIVMSISKLVGPKAMPFLLILLGLLVMIVTEQAIISGAFLVIGISMILNWIWPEKWESKNVGTK